MRCVNDAIATRTTRLLFWLKTLFRVLILALVSWGIWRTVMEAQGKFAQQQFSLRHVHVGWLAAAGVFYLLGMLPCGLFWHRTLLSMGQSPQLRHSLRAYYVSQLGKYVPGKALVVVMRAALIRSRQVDTAVAVTSVFVETLTMMAVGAVVAAAILAVAFREHQYLLLLAIAFATCAAAPTLPPVFPYVIRLLQVHRTSRHMDAAIRGLSFRLMLSGWTTVAAGWLLLGLSLWATLRAMPQAAPRVEDLPLVTVCVALAVVAGFVSLLPAGIGVREIVVMRLLAPPFGQVAAIVSAVLLRLVWLAAELILAGILYAVVRPERAAPDVAT